VTRTRLFWLSLAAVALLSPGASAQGRRGPRWEIRGLDFRPAGVWRARAQQVRRYRAALLSQGAFSTLNAPLASRAPRVLPRTPQASPPQVVSGILKVPAIMFQFRDRTFSVTHTASEYDRVLFSTAPPLGRPYTYRTFYQQMSNGLLDIQGQTYGPATLDSTEVTYVGRPPCSGSPVSGSTNCNGLFTNSQSPGPFTRMQTGLRQALQKLDGVIDFSQYDSNGDGYVDLVVFIQPAVGGECGGPINNHLWSHRAFLRAPFVTTDPDPSRPGQFIRVSDYILQSGVGGSSACDVNQIMPIGTVAHETGHGFGLPDLYGTDGTSEGIGTYGLMGSGNYSSPLSPSRMEAWSLNELGWVTISPLGSAGTYGFTAAPSSDTAFYVRVQGSNPRGEYFLLENRQAVQADSAMIRDHCLKSEAPRPPCGGGLLMWHVDSQQVVNGTRFGGNDVNSGPIHGLALVQADGLGNLGANPSSAGCSGQNPGCSNRGDAGDPYPGTTGNAVFSAASTPAALRNSDGHSAGIGIDQIWQLATDGAMSFRLAYPVSLVRASDTAAVIQFDGVSYNVYRETLDPGTSHTVGVAATQYTAAGSTRHVFVSWSDGGALSHSFTAGATADTLTATLARAHRLVYGPSTNKGSVTANPSDPSGSYIPEGTQVALTASADSTGYVFGCWSGDTTTTGPGLTLAMQRPYSVVASFDSILVITSAPPRRDGVMGAAYADSLRTSGGGCPFSWTVVGGALPPGVSLATSTGVLSGYPKATGSFEFDARVTSGTQSQTQKFAMSVTQPTLATADIVAQLLGTGTPLNADQLRYLDFQGNNNNGFDVGDFKAWVDATGAEP
jgi:M6 family metalloprotease-like protein